MFCLIFTRFPWARTKERHSRRVRARRRERERDRAKQKESEKGKQKINTQVLKLDGECFFLIDRITLWTYVIRLHSHLHIRIDILSLVCDRRHQHSTAYTILMFQTDRMRPHECVWRIHSITVSRWVGQKARVHFSHFFLEIIVPYWFELPNEMILLNNTHKCVVCVVFSFLLLFCKFNISFFLSSIVMKKKCSIARAKREMQRKTDVYEYKYVCQYSFT